MLVSAIPSTFASGSLDKITLSNASKLNIREDGYIVNLEDFPYASELLANFKDNGAISITSASGEALKLTDKVGSDAVVTYNSQNGESSAKVFVSGDTNGDAKISAKDASALLKYLAKIGTACVPAGDVNHDDKTNAKDAAALLKYLSGADVDIAYHSDASNKGEKDDGDIEMYFDTVMNRRDRSDMSTTGDYDRTIYVAKNEIEDVQVLVNSVADKENMTLELTPLTNDNGNTLSTILYYGYYYDFDCWGNGGEEPMNIDPLLVLHDSFKLSANQSKAFVIQVQTYLDTEPGLYCADINLRNEAGEIVKHMALRTFVWNFELSEATATATAFGLNQINNTEQYKQKYDFLLNYRISSYALPYDITDDRADEYMSNPRVTYFDVDGGGYGGIYDKSDEYIVAAYQKLRTNPVWLEKGYVYNVDEPYSDEGFQALRDQWAWLSNLIPEMDFNVICPLANNRTVQGEELDFFDKQIGYITTMCPQTHAFKEYVTKEMKAEKPDGYYEIYNLAKYGFTDGLVYKKRGQFIDRYNEQRENGLKAWWYVCCAPEVPYPNFFTYYQGYHVRVLLWQQYMFDIDGLLYWAVDNYDLGKGNFTNVSLKHTNGGDGLLMYQSELFGVSEVVPSIRLEYVRDGIEDFQYLTQLEELTGSRDASMEYVYKLTQDILHYSADNNEYESVRKDLGFALESASAK